MKKFMILAAVLLAASCAKEAQTAYQTISFRLGDVQSGEMTKVSAEAVSDAISGTTPATTPTVRLTLRSTTNSARLYAVDSDGSIRVPVDEYTVKGEYVPSIKATGYEARYYSEPSFKVNTTVRVAEGVSEYALPVEFTCAAIVIDYSVTKSYDHAKTTSSLVALDCFTKVGEIGIAYVTNTADWPATQPYKIVANPVDLAGHEARTYKLTSVVADGCVRIEKGKWYCFGPSEVSTESGSFRFTMPGWEAGLSE